MTILPFSSAAVTAGLSGFATGLGLFAAVGAQSAFILRQGALRVHIVSVVLVCAVSDAVLIFASVMGLRALTAQAPWLLQGVLWTGVVFLAAYAMAAARRAWGGGESLQAAARMRGGGRAAAVAGALAFTWLNPHFWLDMVLVGTLAHGFGSASLAYGAGAAAASIFWLTLLGGGARLLAPLFRSARAWRILDGMVALIMAVMAVRLAAQALG